MNDMIARGVHALAEVGRVNNLDELDEDMQALLEKEVRAVLHALREPSPRMIKAGSDIVAMKRWGHLAHEDDARETWEGMIDAALEGVN